MSTKQKKWLLIGLILILAAGVKLFLIYDYFQQKDQAAVPLLACSPLAKVCALPTGGQWVFVSPPKHGQPFELRLQGVPSTKEPSVEFTMADMDMGFNRYRFIADGRNWRAKVTLPLCSTGRQDWLATLQLNGQRYQIKFVVE